MTTLAPPLARWLGAADSFAPEYPWETPDVTTGPGPARTAVLTITGMPRALRRSIETAMVVCVPSESDLSVPGADPLTADWFTAWRRSAGPGVRVACRQVITGTESEMAALERVVSQLAHEHDFTAELSLVD
ncbi:hypothetical protein QP028_12590 [Corynebacterium suedekumii]|uniref:Uncharacterized protein n=1 Tax=Corynebacterium suedekumii TaxID=3049801 RepID=A0ABY8VL23_9CORY|nr:hypothetical protein [Corynebacterium suedekumii]WIM70198.1 hypothetical protein QP029_13640 [Corynebacterium suedekumii]WIM72143.1 hypothetical protein QP028_12590 [Corynebacterium suedekumii]